MMLLDLKKIECSGGWESADPKPNVFCNDNTVASYVNCLKYLQSQRPDHNTIHALKSVLPPGWSHSSHRAVSSGRAWIGIKTAAIRFTVLSNTSVFGYQIQL